jgi:hypothetical protein
LGVGVWEFVGAWDLGFGICNLTPRNNRSSPIDPSEDTSS